MKLLPKSRIVTRYPTSSCQHQSRAFSIKFTDDDEKRKAKTKDDGPKSLPDPRGFFRKAYDLICVTFAQRMLAKAQQGAMYRVKVFFGLQKEEPRWFNRIFGSKEPKQYNYFGQKVVNGGSWNPLTRSKTAAKWFIAKVIALVIVLKLSWAFLKSLVLSPFSRSQ